MRKLVDWGLLILFWLLLLLWMCHHGDQGLKQCMPMLLHHLLDAALPQALLSAPAAPFFLLKEVFASCCPVCPAAWLLVPPVYGTYSSNHRLTV